MITQMIKQRKRTSYETYPTTFYQWHRISESLLQANQTIKTDAYHKWFILLSTQKNTTLPIENFSTYLIPYPIVPMLRGQVLHP